MDKNSRWSAGVVIAIVLALIVGVGGYGIYRHNKSQSSIAIPSSETVSVQSVTSPASPGTEATITAQTSPNSDCTIIVKYESGPSHAQGLYEQNADNNGSISWTWFVGTRTTPGTWPIDINCSLNGQSGSANTSFVVN